jgi:hypothetical protein
MLMVELLNEVSWEDRLDFDNHCPHYPTLVTGCLDTFPIQISQPKDSEKARLCFNGKYGCCVVKVCWSKLLVTALVRDKSARAR